MIWWPPQKVGQVEWEDTTSDRIASLKRNIATYEGIIKRYI
jgi:hypothetical protein